MSSSMLALIFQIILFVIFVGLFVAVIVIRKNILSRRVNSNRMLSSNVNSDSVEINSKNKCVHCESTGMVEISREMLDTKTVGQQGGRGDVRVQVLERVTYQCNSCQEKSAIVARITN